MMPRFVTIRENPPINSGETAVWIWLVWRQLGGDPKSTNGPIDLLGTDQTQAEVHMCLRAIVLQRSGPHVFVNGILVPAEMAQGYTKRVVCTG
jgi:hypothetical protein